jgi:hypothetical protein
MAIAKESRPVHDFEEVHMEGHGEVFLTQGETEALEIEADEELLPKIKSEVQDGRLVLGMQHWWDYLLPPWGPVRYFVSMKTIRGIALSGSGAVMSGDIRTDRCHLGMSGSGRASVATLTADEADFHISGSGRIEVGGGAVKRQKVTISGSGHLEGMAVACEEAEVTISGSGNVLLQVAKTLDVHISGSGDVRYRGQPAVSQHISGSGRISHVEG